MIQFEGATLTDDEQDNLTARLSSAIVKFRDEYSHLCHMGPRSAALLAECYQFPAEGPGAWLAASSDAIFVAAEVSGATASSAYWAR